MEVLKTFTDKLPADLSTDSMVTDNKIDATANRENIRKLIKTLDINAIFKAAQEYASEDIKNMYDDKLMEPLVACYRKESNNSTKLNENN